VAIALTSGRFKQLAGACVRACVGVWGCVCVSAFANQPASQAIDQAAGCVVSSLDWAPVYSVPPLLLADLFQRDA